MPELNEDIINIEVIQNITNVETQIDGSTDAVLLNIDRTYSNIDITLASTGEKGDPGTTDHPLLDHLDYESSGHTGFASELEITEINQTLSNKVDKVTGKGLSTNDYTDLEKTKLAGIENGAEVNVNADWNSTSGDSKILNKPYIPTNVSDLNNDSGFITTEVDPVFTSSAAHSISNADITNWNDAYSKEHIHTNKTALDLVEGSNKGDETNASIISKIGYTPENISNKGIASGYVPLNTSTKIDTAYLPDSIVGQLHYVGTWNANTNTPTIVSSTGNKGDYYIVSVSGSTTVDGISDWVIGDWLVFNGSTWDKIDNTDSISSFNGRTGAITLISNDVTTALGYTPVTNTRTLTINGSTYDLSANRTWNVGDILSTGSYINPEWITSLSWNKITSTPTTLSGYGISSSDTLFDTKYQPMLPSTPTDPTQMYLNGNLQWSTISVGNGGYAANLYNSTSASTIVNGYSQLSYTPDASETQYTNTITNQEVLFRTYLYESTIGTNIIDAGLWTGSFTAKVSNSVGVTQLKFEPFLRHTDGTETILFSVYSPEIDNTDFVTIKLESSQGLFNVATTDRFGLRVYGKTTSGAAITITIIIGDGRGGYIVIPVRLRHNQLRDLNGDANYLHNTQTQQTNWNSAYSFTSNYSTNYPDLTAIENLSGTSGLLRKTSTNTWSLDTSEYVKNLTTCTLYNEGYSLILKGFDVNNYGTSNWNPQSLTYQAWGENFINYNISNDQGRIVWWLRPGVYGGSGTELNVTINGDFYSNNNKVWHAGNLTNNNQLSNGAGYLTGITSSQVTTALGYTPYNSTNPSGYITSSALSGYATQSWVSSNYLGINATAVKSNSLAVTDNRDADRQPTYYAGRTISTFFNASIPVSGGNWVSGINVAGWDVSSYNSWQLFGGSTTGSSGHWWLREGLSSWGGSYEILHSGNYTSYNNYGSLYSSIYYDSADSSYYCDPNSTSVLSSALFKSSIQINPNIQQIVFRNEPSSWHGTMSYDSGGTECLGIMFKNISTKFKVKAGYDSSTFAGGGVYTNMTDADLEVGQGYSKSPNMYASVYYDRDDPGYYVNPNSTSRLYIIKANTLGVVQSNGGGDGLSLYGDYTGGQPIYGIMFALTSNFSTHGAVTADWATYFTMDSTANRGWIFRNMNGSGNVASISNGGTATFNGNVYAPNFILSSDRNLKMNIQPIINDEIDIEYKSFELKSQPGEKRYGVIAQELQEIEPELVCEDKDGILSVKYIDLLVKEVAYLKNKVKELERRLK